MLRHQEEFGGILYKYDLPVVNKPAVFKSLQIIPVEEEPTALLNLYDRLEIDKDTSYESFVIKMNQTFNNEIDMYGDIKKAGESNLRVLDFGIPIPFDFINDEDNMKKLRMEFRYNPDMPGAIELVHPNKFLPSTKFKLFKSFYRFEAS